MKPGNRSNMRLYMNKQFIRQYYHAFNTAQLYENILNGDDMTSDDLCTCTPYQVPPGKHGLNDPTLPTSMRVAQQLQSRLGGKTTYGNRNRPAQVNWSGGWEGQPGGMPRPPRN